MRRRSLTIAVSMGLILSAALTAAWLGAVGTTRYVDDNTCPATGSGTLANPYCRIQDAICASASGDTVSVAPGTYLESLRMRPGVSVLSQQGAAVTTINATGKPCTDKNFCGPLAGSTQCSVVIFGSGHTLATHLEGFTLTGGSGVNQASPAQIAGGGIFVFSSATIMNNVITNNVLSGARAEYNGGGVYVALGAPVISNNTIAGNRAVPPAGALGAVTYGYGGGVYVGFFSDPIITNNIITGNRAGDPNVAYSLGGGGGITLTPGDPNHTGPVIDRNLIADNSADSIGGGLAANSRLNTAALAVVTNNVIVGNTAYKNGGGVYIYFDRNNTINNTISGNTAFLGGGIYSGQGDPNLPVSITNNIIEGNHLFQFGNGGGLYTLDLSTTFDPNIRYNDFWGNDRNQVAGDQTDATIIGFNGNFSLDPRFISKPTRDFHLDPNSPAIDRAQAAGSPPVDKDNLPRGVDGNGIPNNPVAGDVDVGAYEKQATCTPSPEICDNLDNDCNGLIDDGLGSTTCGTGACQRTVQNCVGGVTQNCTPGTPTTEVCDGIDNNCDGLVDEGFGTTTCGTGACQRTVQNCLGGVTQTCTPGSPTPEVCDGVDNNCNGTVDENLGSTTCGTGACQRTVQNCVGGVSQTCTPGVPTAEVCDGIDNDCNGIVDDGFPDTDGDGLKDCIDPDDDNDGVLDAADCAPLDATAFGWPAEVANLDVTGVSPTHMTYDTQNIGSGTRYQIISGLMSRLLVTHSFNEDFCAAAQLSGGAWNDSRPSPGPGDAWYYIIQADNDCANGTLGSPLADQQRPSTVCQVLVLDQDGDGSPSDLDCNDHNPAQSPLLPEVCDGIDNNCNGAVDENLGSTTCGLGACEVTVQNCVAGVVQTCTPGAPTAEVCDGIDNNCDGTVDEGNPGGGAACGSSVGECVPGVTLCAGGGLSCVGAVGPTPEICDGKDNNCNAQIDEGFPDTDGDGIADCVDPDDDNDGVLDAADCAPLDATAFGVPQVVQDIDVVAGGAGLPTQVSWVNQNIGSGTQYLLAGGTLSGQAGAIDFSQGACLVTVSGTPALDARPDPPADTIVYYLVKARNACGQGSYGSPAEDALPSCP